MIDGEICGRHFETGLPVRVWWRDGVITEVEPFPDAADNPCWIAPDLVDLQINGYAGIDFQQDNVRVEDLLVAVRGLRKDGCSRFLLTLITADWATLTARLRRFRTLRAQSAELKAAIAGWHIEGPFLSGEPGFHGAHDPALMLDPQLAHIQELRAITGADPLLLTMAPERPGALEAIALARALGIKISLGHTDASAVVLKQAVAAGATAFTHLGNGCPRELDRHDNILWRVLDTPGLTVSVIPDRIHVSPPLFRLLHQALEPAAIYYTTDAMAAAGAGPGRYRIGRFEVAVGDDQVVRQPGKTNFAGSALSPGDGITRAAEMLNCSWRDVWAKFSLHPARLMDLPWGLEIGKPASFRCFTVDAENRLSELKIAGQKLPEGRC